MVRKGDLRQMTWPVISLTGFLDLPTLTEIKTRNKICLFKQNGVLNNEKEKKNFDRQWSSERPFATLIIQDA